MWWTFRNELWWNRTPWTRSKSSVNSWWHFQVNNHCSTPTDEKADSIIWYLTGGALLIMKSFWRWRVSFLLLFLLLPHLSSIFPFLHLLSYAACQKCWAKKNRACLFVERSSHAPFRNNIHTLTCNKCHQSQCRQSGKDYTDSKSALPRLSTWMALGAAGMTTGNMSKSAIGSIDHCWSIWIGVVMALRNFSQANITWLM